MAVIVATSPRASFTASLESALRCSAGTSRRRRAPSSVTPTRNRNRIEARLMVIMPTFPRDHFIMLNLRSSSLLVFAVNRDCTAIQAQLPAAAKIRFLLLLLPRFLEACPFAQPESGSSEDSACLDLQADQ